MMLVPSLSSTPPNCSQEMFTFFPHFFLLLSVGGDVGFLLSDQLFVRDAHVFLYFRASSGRYLKPTSNCLEPFEVSCFRLAK